MKRIFSFGLALVISVSCCMSIAFATNPIEPRASLTLSRYSVDLVAVDSRGVIGIGYDIRSNKQATSIGIETIEIYTQNGSYVTTITGTTRNGLVRTNRGIHKGTYEYALTSGVSYYAKITVFAEVGSDYDSRTITTGTVKVS